MKVYILESCGSYKVGVSGNINKRINTLSIGNPFDIKLVYETEELTSNSAYFIESLVHEELKEYNIRGEWFNCELNLIINTLRLKIGTKDIKPVYIEKLNNEYKSISDLIIINNPELFT